MALTGVFITWGQAALVLQGQQSQQPLMGKAVSSELMASPGISTTSAPSKQESSQIPLLSISSSAPIYYVVGPNADASQAGQPRRYYDPAWGPYPIVAAPGDRFSWIAA